ncbi:pyridoxal kinase PdxY [Solicola gregarius]|uniref:pyridoxal kinase n=1 Tax=Solicola gregarius TaxID=2908642 RepID=A0AA46THI6_9ACTN|nr:pyridoxal kinase PdxY [Solicola gregarius]UYM05380.1 pyridoxal kinase PdxY [Solicola gregarius]
MQILSIQSAVAYGHVGNSAAVFPLQRMGIEVWPVNTVEFSNHTGYGSWKGPVLPAADVAAIVDGVRERGVFEHLDAVLSGYQGAEDVGAVVVETVQAVKAANPNAIYCADPVMGDRWCGFYVRAGIPEFMRERVLPVADVTTPNQFELEFLAEHAAESLDDVVAAAQIVRERGPQTVLVTSVEGPDIAPDQMGMLAVSDAGAHLVRTPKLDLATVSGSGDATAAVFLANLLRHDVATALGRTAAAVYAILEVTAKTGSTEMELIAAQAQITDPTVTFEVTRL